MSLRAIPFQVEHAPAWDHFCDGAFNATLLHTRRFLSYHGDRFQDRSIMIFHGESLVGVLPAAVHPGDPSAVVSHPGATFGGMVHQGHLLGERMLDALAMTRELLHQQGHASLLYKAIPHTYTDLPAQDDLYALFRLGASRSRCDLSSTICLSHRRPKPERRRRALKKALAQVRIGWDVLPWPTTWQLIADNLARKHGATPVHTAEELALLQERFPQNIRVVSASCDDTAVAAVVLFNARRVWHAQYIASSERGHDCQALDAVFEAAVDMAERAGAHYFDFGTSNEESGLVLNGGLYQFKSEFGGGGVAHEFYQLSTS